LADVNTGLKPSKTRIEISPAAIVIALVVLAGLGLFGWLTFGPKPPPPPPVVLTQEARSYLSNLKLSDVKPQTSESYVGKSLFEIMGKITNGGNRTLSNVTVNCVFYDYSGKEVHRELATVVGKTGSLAPNATKSFRLAFDDVPDNWNQQMPLLVIAQIKFQ
jgi:hypothetical protein